MLSACELKDGKLMQIRVDSKEDLTRKETIWIDLASPTDEERELVQSLFRLELPEDEELQDLQASERYYQDEDGVHIRATFIESSDEAPRNTTLSFTLHGGRLLTVHDDDLSFLRLFRMRARVVPGMVSDAVDIILGCYAVAVEHDSDILEEMYKILDEVGALILNKDEITDRVMRDHMERIVAQEDLNGKVRLDLMDNRRALSFLLRSRILSLEQNEELRGILRDIESLNGHTGFIAEKINFLMDGLLGLINLAQNKIIKIFSIAAVVFLPPTLVASIYGMNFANMPELQWPFGYPLAIFLMIIAAVTPYWYFKQKGWLD